MVGYDKKKFAVRRNLRQVQLQGVDMTQLSALSWHGYGL